jgi:predicted dehydrogenase
MSENQETPGTSRREFLQKAAVTTAVGTTVAYMPTTAEGMRRVLGANDRLQIGHVGVGVQGGYHVNAIKENASANNVQQIAVCDLYVRARKNAAGRLGLKDSQIYADYRKLLANKDIDVIVIATSDNWHADIAVDALNAGKHVYCEKPMCKTLEETFRIYDTVKKTGKKFQIGAQRCSENRWHIARKLVADGAIGKVVLGQASYMRNSGLKGEWNDYKKIDKGTGPTATGDNYIDWETFRKNMGPKEWDPDRFFRWRKYWAYGSGLVGDLFPHRLYPLFIAMNLPVTGYGGWPLRVSSGGGLYVQKKHPEFSGKIDREVPDFTNIQIDFPEECTIMAISSTINEVEWQEMIRGHKASMYPGPNGIEIKPERIWAEEIEGSVEPVTGPGEDIPVHHKNLFDSIRSGKEPSGNIEVAARVQVAITLGEMSYRQSKTFTFDPKTRTCKS